jgi:threonine/homoserine/homoserine lactone efflux protein
VAGYGIAIPVGAVALLIVNTSIQCGFRVGFFAGAGAASADFIYAMLAGLAGAALEQFLRPVAAPLQLASGIVLVLVAASIFWHGIGQAEEQGAYGRTCGPWRMYVQFLAITIVNPLTVVYFTALILGGGTSTESNFLTIGSFVLGVGVASLSWQTLLAGIGGLLRGRLPGSFRRLSIIVGSLLVAILGLRVIISAIPAFA